ncbi:FCD domain-containing protein [Streptomyces pseudogriseolus]|uniref:FCD domain-containing protein n=1 Tax=Streptomyces pseudogriseolus TaxID=36817 RepID=UPI00348A75A3
MVRDLRRRSRLYGLTALAEQGRLRASAEEHLELLDALLARDAEAVRTVMTRHLGHVRGTVGSALTRLFAQKRKLLAFLALLLRV